MAINAGPSTRATGRGANATGARRGGTTSLQATLTPNPSPAAGKGVADESHADVWRGVAAIDEQRAVSWWT